MNKIIKNIFLTILIYPLLMVGVFAQPTTDSKVSLNKTELQLDIPEVTDNPNYQVTYVDPSGKGIYIQIDGADLIGISTPYSLPSLGIGKHIITFKYTDSQDTIQTFDCIIYIIPRPPVIDTPIVDTDKNEIQLTGTSIPLSDLQLLLIGPDVKNVISVKADENGDWNYTIQKELVTGIYSIVASSRKLGYTSEFSDIVKIEVKKTQVTIGDSTGIVFSFDLITKDNIEKVIRDNRDLLILVGITLVAGLLIGMIIDSLVTNKRSSRTNSLFKSMLKKSENKTESNAELSKADKTMTLREKFEKAGIINGKSEIDKKVLDEAINEEIEFQETSVPDKEEVTETITPEPTKTSETPKIPNEEVVSKNDIEEIEKVVSKEEFLEQFKDFDPDDDKGVETNKILKLEKPKSKNKSKSMKRNIKISLTSKD